MFSKVAGVITYVYDFYLGYDSAILVWNPTPIGYTVAGVGPIATIFSAFIFVKASCMLYQGILVHVKWYRTEIYENQFWLSFYH